MRKRWWLMAACCVACRNPTQVTLDISTDLDCGARLTTSIADGSPEEIATVAPATTTQQCAPGGEIGTLVFVPSHARDDRLAVQVVMAVGVPLDSCKPPLFGKDCIVASRSFRYIPHTGLTLPIAMRSACKGVVCPNGQTCSNGQCVSAEIDLSTCSAVNGCAEPGPPVGDASVDGGVAPVDASMPVDSGGTDASETAVTVATGRPLIAAITSDATGAYWTEPGDVFMANGGVFHVTASGVMTTLATLRESPGAIVVDATSAFWAELLANQIAHAPIGGGAATGLPLAGGIGTNMTALGIDGTSIYWNNEDTGNAPHGLLRRAGKDGSNPQTITTGILAGPWTFAVSGTTLAFITSPHSPPIGPGAVSTVPIAGGAPTSVSSLSGTAAVAHVAASGSNLAWVTTDNGGSVMVRTAAGLLPLATGQGQIASLAASATAVYWVHGPAGGAGRLTRASWSGGAEDIFTGIAVPGPITVNASDVYFVDNRIGEIKHVPR